MQFREKIHQGITALMEKGETDAAEWMLDKFLLDHPDHDSAHYELAMLAHNRGDSQRAGVHFKKAAALKPDNVLYLGSLGDYYNVSLNSPDEALRTYEQVLLLQPENLDVLLTAAHLLVSKERFEDASIYYQKVLRINPEHSDAKQILEKLSTHKLNHKQQDSVEALYETACQQVQSGQKQEAAKSLEKLLALDPDNGNAQNDLGVLCYELGDKEKALAHYRKAVDIKPDNGVYQKNIADFLWVENGDAEGALAAYKHALDQNPQDIEALLGFANICIEIDRSDDAREFIDCVLMLDPTNPSAKRLQDRIDVVPSILTGKDEAENLYDQAQAKAAAGDHYAAIEDLKSLVRTDSNCAIAYNDLGVLYYQVGDKENALASYERSYQIDPLAPTTLKNLADFYLIEQHRVDEAMQLYHKALQQNREDIECLLATAFVCTLLQKDNDAEEFYQRVIELDPTNRPANEALEKIAHKDHQARAFSSAQNV